MPQWFIGFYLGITPIGKQKKINSFWSGNILLEFSLGEGEENLENLVFLFLPNPGRFPDSIEILSVAEDSVRIWQDMAKYAKPWLLLMTRDIVKMTNKMSQCLGPASYLAFTEFLFYTFLPDIKTGNSYVCKKSFQWLKIKHHVLDKEAFGYFSSEGQILQKAFYNKTIGPVSFKEKNSTRWKK